MTKIIDGISSEKSYVVVGSKGRGGSKMDISIRPGTVYTEGSEVKFYFTLHIAKPNFKELTDREHSFFSTIKDSVGGNIKGGNRLSIYPKLVFGDLSGGKKGKFSKSKCVSAMNTWLENNFGGYGFSISFYEEEAEFLGNVISFSDYTFTNKRAYKIEVS